MSRLTESPARVRRSPEHTPLGRPHPERSHEERLHFERPHFDYAHFAQGHLGSRLTKALRLPRPAPLRRYSSDTLIDGVVLIDGYAEAVVAARMRDNLGALGIPLADAPPEPPGVSSLAAVIVDMTSITEPHHLETMRAIIAPALRCLAPCGRVIAIVRPPQEASTVAMAAARRGVDGAIRSLAKELEAGTTANTVEIADMADGAAESVIRFLLSGRSAYVSGQLIRVGAPVGPLTPPLDWTTPLAQCVAVVTGAASGIGEATARTLARDGAVVVCVDVPAREAELALLSTEIGGSALTLDITDPHAGARIAAHCREHHGGLDIVTHVAGTKADGPLSDLDLARWRTVMEVNLTSVLRMNDALIPAIREGGHVVFVSSTTGLAGNRGQANYAASKAGVIAMTSALAGQDSVRAKQVTVNAVAPGYIATTMTADTPVLAREVGKFLNSLHQAGLPTDVAEVISWLCWPETRGVNGETIRVCGQLLTGA